MLNAFLKLLTRILVPPYKNSPLPSKRVAIVVPAPAQQAISGDEDMSLRHLNHFLHPYDKFLIVPQGARLRLEGLQPVEISRKFFGSTQAHNQLLHNPYFYHLFADYRYILIYHLDALVFADELLHWCDLGADFIGAPWIPCSDTPWVVEPHVGNGGFALMNVESCLRVTQNRYRLAPRTYWHDRFPNTPRSLRRSLQLVRQFSPPFLRSFVTLRLRQELRRMSATETTILNSDRFWAGDATRFSPNFRIPDWRTGLRFAFEAAPRQCFELNQRRMPFGCHAWTRFDRSFWEPHLLKD